MLLRAMLLWVVLLWVVLLWVVLLWVVRLAVVLGQHVVAEVAAGSAQHGVSVVSVVGGVVLDEQVIALDPVVVPRARG